MLDIREDLLTVNPYSRKGKKLTDVKAIVLHWVANPMSTAQGNRNFFEDRKDGTKSYGSAHYIIDDTEIINCVPEDEVTWNCGSATYTDMAKEKFGDYYTRVSSPNFLTIGIELCHNDWSGKFSAKVLGKAKMLCLGLCKKYDLNPLTDIVTHHEVVGWKDCPRWFTENPELFEKFKMIVNTKLINGE